MIYYWDEEASSIYLIDVYSKTDVGDLSRAQLKELAKLVREELK